MTRAVERVEQEIAALNQAIAAIAQEFRKIYRQYLTALGQAVRQQLVLAGYHICTQGYPEAFLELSLSQRQDLQQALQRLARQAQIQLPEKLQQPKPAESSVSEEVLLIYPEDFPDLESNPEQTSAMEDLEVGTANIEHSELQAEADEPSPDLASQEQSTEQQTDERPITPVDLANWQDDLEERIVEMLQDLSHSANRLLQQAGILPSELPEPVLEVAAKADLVSETSATPPNLLNLLIESETATEKESTMTQVLAIRLRLSEIEFSDPNTAVWRSKIRNLLVQLNKLGREYQKKQKERAIAEAEAAWRSSWYED
jgi:hypothetical protein